MPQLSAVATAILSSNAGKAVQWEEVDRRRVMFVFSITVFLLVEAILWRRKADVKILNATDDKIIKENCRSCTIKTVTLRDLVVLQSPSTTSSKRISNLFVTAETFCTETLYRDVLRVLTLLRFVIVTLRIPSVTVKDYKTGLFSSWTLVRGPML